MTTKVVFFDIGDTLVRKAEAGEMVLIESAFPTIKAFREAGLITGVISNTGDLTRDQLTAALPSGFLFEVFEPSLLILSSEVGIEKPSPEIFHLAFQRAELLFSNLTPNQCLFCGENQEEVLTAQCSGFLGARVLPSKHGNDLAALPKLLLANLSSQPVTNVFGQQENSTIPKA